MDNFKIIYKILKILESAMSLEEFDKSLISAEKLNLSIPLWSRIMKMLVDNGYVTGIEVWNSFDCDYPKVSLVRSDITLKGLEYLNDNSLMKKIANAAKGITEVISNVKP